MRVLILVAALLAPLPAMAQAWQRYAYPEHGFVVQLPAPPTLTKGQFRTAAGATVPATVYTLNEPDIVFSMTVADFTQTSMNRDAALADAVKAYGATGQIKLNVEERVNQEYGRQLTLVGNDGSRSNVSVFFVNNRLYELQGKALPPEPAAGAGKAVRFQQSLSFVPLGTTGPGHGGPPGQAGPL
ncbi:MAG TPA: hypothetical protein VL358_12900 [Caulobacteraceae bacterium]|jgi:hypothetical protein|nr:hypothetical protein [Caulobacteraceae bacterium]